MRRVVTGEQVAQIYNPDPFARPVFRAPVYRTPAGLILLAWLVRLIIRLLRLVFRHPVPAVIVAVLAFLWVSIGWIGVTLLTGWAVLVLVIWWHYWPVTFARWAATPARSKWRAWGYRRKWAAVTSIADLAPFYRGRIILPVLVKVTSTLYVDRVYVRLVSGQCAADFADRADNLAHGFGALLCRVRTARSGAVLLEFVRREDGLPWLVRLHGTHLLIAGATGAGKASLLWGLVRAMLPLMRAGLVRVLAADPKLMELAYGRVIFDTYGQYAASPVAIAEMLDQAVADMQARAAAFAGRQRDHTPTREHPFTVVLVDEVAFLTDYQPDRKLKERIMLALATLTTQGRALGYAVVAALQDPRKDVLTIRNLFPDRIAMRLDEPEQVDMVLGDGARDRGAACELISTDPATGAGVAFIRLEADPDPVRVRAGWVTDTDIRDMTAECAADQEPRAIEAVAA